jgi:hypothetical protein
MNNYASAIDCEMLGLLDQRKDGRKQKETKIICGPLGVQILSDTRNFECPMFSFRLCGGHRRDLKEASHIFMSPGKLEL